jgi:hypothetical protein
MHKTKEYEATIDAEFLKKKKATRGVAFSKW